MENNCNNCKYNKDKMCVRKKILELTNEYPKEDLITELILKIDDAKMNKNTKRVSLEEISKEKFRTDSKYRQDIFNSIKEFLLKDDISNVLLPFNDNYNCKYFKY